MRKGRLNSDQPRAKGRLNSDGLCFIEEYQITPYAALCSHCIAQ